MEEFSFNKLQDKTKDDIKKYIEVSLLHLGVNATITITPYQNRRGEENVKVESTDIMCQPMIFKRVYVIGNLYFNKGENDEVYEIQVPLSYRFETFTGGSNGTELGTIVFNLYFSDSKYQSLLFQGFTLPASIPMSFH